MNIELTSYKIFSILTTIVFILNPLLGILILGFFCLKKTNIPDFMFILLFVFMASWMGVINMTKLPDSDMINYLDLFYRVPKDGFSGTIITSNVGQKEPLYALITFFGYYITLGNGPIFIFLLTITMYMLILLSLFKLYKNLKFSNEMIICGAFVLVFFTQYFLMTAHLIRQLLAISIIIYALVEKSISGKNNWFLLISATLIHTMSLFFVIISVIPQFRKKLSNMMLINSIICIFIIIVFHSQISTLFSNSSINSISYAANRFSQTSDNIEGLTFTSIISMSIILIILIKNLISLKQYNNSPLYLIIYSVMFLIIMIITFSTNTLIQFRFFVCLYSFFPLIIPLLFRKYTKLSYYYCRIVPILFVLRFLFIHNTSMWKYNDTIDILLSPFPLIFLGTHPY